MQNMSYQVFEALSLLKPFDIDIEKIRIGRERDGGYILADVPSNCDVMSFGICGDVAFEKQMAEMGHKTIYMYDHTIPGLPEDNRAFVFNKIGICPEGSISSDLLPITTLIEMIPNPTERMILKVDVEGCEWDVFATMPTETLAKFDQIVVELHWFRNLIDPDFAQTVIRALKNINSQFTLFHVHANNHCDLHIIGGFAVADVIEVSYIRTSLVERRRSGTIYPTGIDNANYPRASDLPLLFYPFLPSAVSDDRITEVIKRILLEAAALNNPEPGSA
jgi:hypothetical protein